MTIIVHWLESDITKIEEIKFPTSLGILKVYQYDNVITKTEWCFETSVDTVFINSLAREIQSFLNNETFHLAVNLQKQGTNYRLKVWEEICKIPVGQVISYSALAKKIDSGARAVANACRDNPFPGIIPCHRVVSMTGLGGYMGQTSGMYLEIKKKILRIESMYRL